MGKALKTSVAILAILLGVYGIVSAHSFAPGYEPTYAAGAEGLLRTGAPELMRDSPFFQRAVGGTPVEGLKHVYPGPTTGFAGPVTAVPLMGPAMLADELREKRNKRPSWGFRQAAAYAYARVLIALTAVMVYLLALAFFGRQREAVLLALAFGLTTLAVPYTKIGMEPPLVFWATATFGAAYLARRRAGPGWYAAAGVAAGFAGATRMPAALVLVAPLLLYLLWPALRGRAEGRRWVNLAAFAVPFAALVAVSVAYNVTRCDEAICGLGQQAFGAAAPGGVKTDKARAGFFEGLYGLLLSPGKSFFVTSPIMVLGAVGLWRGRRAMPAEALTVAAMFVLTVGLLAPLSYWSEEMYGARYLLYLVPFFTLFVGFAMGWAPGLELADAVRRRVKWVLATLLSVGLLMQLAAVTPPGSASPCAYYVKPLLGQARFDQNYCRFVPELSDAVMNGRLTFAWARQFLGLGRTTLVYEPYVGAPGGTIERRTLPVNIKRPEYFWAQKRKTGKLILLGVYILVIALGGWALLRLVRE